MEQTLSQEPISLGDFCIDHSTGNLTEVTDILHDGDVVGFHWWGRSMYVPSVDWSVIPTQWLEFYFERDRDRDTGKPIKRITCPDNLQVVGRIVDGVPIFIDDFAYMPGSLR